MINQKTYCVAVLGAGLLAFGCGQVFAANDNNNGNDTKPEGKGSTLQHDAHPAGNSRPGTNGISYHGGPVMTQGANVHYIWYGNWSSSDPNAQSILENLASYIGG